MKFAGLSIIALLFSIVASAQGNYNSDWQKVAGLEKKGLVKDATNLVNAIYTRAIREKNQPQQLKAVMYLMAYRNNTEEDALPRNLLFTDSLIQKTATPARYILYSMQAELFWNYLQQNRYRIHNRTDIQKFDNNDIRTWSIEKLTSRTTELYRLSTADKNILRQTPVKSFSEIIQKGKNTEGLRPTLYDLLVHRALDWFTSDDHTATAPVYRFLINDPAFFGGAQDFVKLNIISKDTSSLHLEAMKLFRELLSYHLSQRNLKGLIDADLRRLQFVYNHSTLPEKDMLYEEALKNIESQFPTDERTGEAMLLRAQLYLNKVHSSVNNQKKKEWTQQALVLLEQIISKYPDSNVAAKSANHIEDIKRPSLSVRTEKVVIPGIPSKGFVQSSNISVLYFKAIPATREEIKKFTEMGAEASEVAQIAKKNGISWNISLPSAGDHLLHTYEFMIPTLATGSYFFISSAQPDFRISGGYLTVAPLYSSNLAYIAGSDSRLYVMDRQSGEPVSGATVNVFTARYDYAQRKRTEIKTGAYRTDKDGLVNIEVKNARDGGQTYQIINGKDELFTGEDHYYYAYNGRIENERKEGFIYTDRSIYRPGQNLHFKSILIKRSGNNRSVLANHKTRMILLDANYQEIGAVNATTNEYGSYHGTFTLPVAGLTGQFILRDTATNSQAYINVEEYKRPRFKVELQKPTGDYKVNDSIMVKGNAQALAGNNISNARVNYRVVRQVRYPFWPWDNYSRIWPPGRSESQEIANGIIETDSEGNFIITFKAIPDLSADHRQNPVFHYEVFADITDINGETRSATSTVAVGYKSVNMSVGIQQGLTTDTKPVIEIKTTNLNGVPLKTNVDFKIEKLQHPGKIFKTRYWDDPEFQTIDSVEHNRIFPNDPYRIEYKPETWKIESTVLTKTTNTSADGSISDTVNALPGGWYRLKVKAVTHRGDTIENIQFFEVSGNTTLLPLKSYVTKTTAKPGEIVKHSVVTGLNKARVIQTVSRMEAKPSFEYRNINKSLPYSQDVKVNENDRGGISIENILVWQNRFYRTIDVIMIPWTNKELNVTVESFRDKTLPGSEETISIKISGEKGNEAGSELLAAMYDASLDQFKPHSWQNLMSIWPTLQLRHQWNTSTFAEEMSRPYFIYNRNIKEVKPEEYDRLLNNGWSYGNYAMAEVAVTGRMRGVTVQSANREEKLADGAADMSMAPAPPSVADTAKAQVNTPPSVNNVPLRTDFSETAFFFPSIKTDEKGNISFSYRIPEALTQWKLMGLAHTPDLKSGYVEKTVTTRKQLMIQPNYTRFLREGDATELAVKVVNMENQELTGIVQLELIDAANNRPVDGWFKNVLPSQYFTVPANSSVVTTFPLTAPENYNSVLIYRIKAVTTKPEGVNYSDGEETSIPILSRRVLVTESLPLSLRGNQSQKEYSFTKLIESSKSETILHKGLTIEYTSNPVWYVVQALPYLSESPYEGSEQVYSRLYANLLASHIAVKMPKLREVISNWNLTDTAALVSNLFKNQELKNILIEETPWLLEAKTETEQKRNIRILFDLIRISTETTRNFKKLSDLQTPNGGFPWFKGGPDDRYISQHILTGFGRLLHIGALTPAEIKTFKPLVNKALAYADARITDEYKELMKRKPENRESLSSYAVQYLYMRSYFDNAYSTASKTAHSYFMNQAEKHWLKQSKFNQAMIALAMKRSGNRSTAQTIIKSLDQFAIKNDLGMYWKEMTQGGFYWHQAPIETQATMIEAFAEIHQERNTVDELKTWLIFNKQTNNWKTTKATADAVYAVLINGSDWTSEERSVQVKLGTSIISPTKEEAGTGYFKEVIKAEDVKPVMGNISVTTQAPAGSTSVSWGSVYWQYFEDADKVTSAKTPLNIVKSVFVETPGDRGPQLKKLENGNEIQLGDKVIVRIELRSDRDMEYVHMKDMRAAALEPVNVLSSYRYRDGLGYYESTRDVSTSFFFDRLPKGTYVFEYSLFAGQTGNFSNGITIIECMYAPEFRSHSEGIRLNVTERK